MAWEKDSYKVPCLPQGESAWATKVEQAENSNLGLDECFLLKCSGVQVQVKRRRPPPLPPRKCDYDLETWVVRGHKGRHKSAAAWSTLMGHNGPEDLQGGTSSKSNHHPEVVTDSLWHPFIMQMSEPSFLYPHYGERKATLCLQENNTTLNWIVAMETMWESLLNCMWEAEVYACI